MIGHRSLEQQVAGRARGEVVLEGPEIEHLLVAADVGGSQHCWFRPCPASSESVRSRA